MSANLAFITSQASVRRSLLKKDWSVEEKAWEDGIGAFLSMIAPANGNCAHEKREEKKEDSTVSGVIIKEDNAGEPVVGPLAKIPPRPKDKKMDSNDLEDLFGPPSNAEPKKEDAKKEEGPFASSGKESSFGDFPPATAAEPTDPPKAEEAKPAKPEKAKETKALEKTTLCDGFDAVTFKNKVMSVVESILQTIPDIDLDQMQSSIDDYAVHISVDAYRSDIDSIANHIAEIQAKRDSIISPLSKLSAHQLAVDEGLDFVINVGVSCSAASNRERRVSEVHYMTGDLFRKWIRLRFIHEQYDKMYRHLGSQMEALSRLLTAQIERAKQVYLGNQRNDEFKGYAEGLQKGIVSSNKVPVMQGLDFDQEVSRMAAEEKAMREVSPQVTPTMPFDVDAKTPTKPTQAVEGMSGLETFNAAPVKKVDKFKKGVVEW